MLTAVGEVDVPNKDGTVAINREVVAVEVATGRGIGSELITETGVGATVGWQISAARVLGPTTPYPETPTLAML